MVDQKRCDERHSWLKWIIGLATVVVGSSGWAGFSAKHSLEVHEAVQEKTEKHRDETLDRIETMVKDLHAREPP